MRVYLDTCSLQRPLDDKSQPRVNLEAEAVLTILRLVESGEWQLLSSDALIFEIGRIPDQFRVARATEMLALASEFIDLDNAIEKLAKTFTQQGIGSMDAVHLATALHANADCFCTCDDDLLRKGRNLKELSIRVISPLELAAEAPQ